jgi:hypothetical protein
VVCSLFFRFFPNKNKNKSNLDKNSLAAKLRFLGDQKM